MKEIRHRKIIHIDMDAFFASVEQRDNPELKGKPVAVGGSSQRGVVAAASYEARKYGVRSAMPSVVALRKCPSLIFVKPRFDQYAKVSRQIREIFFEYTDLVEPLSLDEAYLDVTVNKKSLNSGTLIAEEIRKRIRTETNLTASAGVSINKFVAKVASDVNKPNGIKVITPEEVVPFLESLAIEKFHGIGKVTAKKMRNMNIKTGADLKKLTELQLLQYFGKVGRFYYKLVRGEDNRPVEPNRQRKSIGVERTFTQDLNGLTEMISKLENIADELKRRMDKGKNYGRTVSLKIRYSDFSLATRSKTSQREITKKEEIMSICKELLKDNIETGQEVRLLGIYISNLQKEISFIPGKQLEFEFQYLE